MLVFVVAVLALGVLWLGTRAVSLAADGVVVPSHAGLPWVVVGQGDTLWSIADAVSPGMTLTRSCGRSCGSTGCPAR